MTLVVRAAKNLSQPAEVPVALGDAPSEKIARLAVLHDEAAETSLLAHLLGRATYAALGLGLSASVAAAQWDGALGPLLVWLILVGAGLMAVFHAYDDSVAPPFELKHLRARSSDLSAIMLYVGFAWGAGSFLALDPDASLGSRVIFAAGASVFVAVAVRNLALSACFLLPVTVLATGAALLQPVEGRLLDTTAVLASCAGVGLASLVFDRRLFRGRSTAPHSLT